MWRSLWVQGVMRVFVFFYIEYCFCFTKLFGIGACEIYSYVQAQLECNASNAKTRGSCCEG
jgi:hypothetical protein